MRLIRISGLLLLAALAGASTSSAQIALSITIAPPELPVYEQPPIPAPGYIWTPGYWAVIDSDYVWHEGYWAPHVGFYGGINYGFGYYGSGFYGGMWEGRDFDYNTAVWRVNPSFVHNTYADPR